MIERVTVAGHASYGINSEEMCDLKAVNFVYGPNAVGKTTVSRIIGGARPNEACGVRWERGTELETLVYNRDFVKANFSQTDDLKGIFTLGTKDIEAQKKIDAAKKEIDGITQTIEKLNQALRGSDGNGGKIAERNDIESKFREECWGVKIKHDPKLQGAMTGVRDSKEKFKTRMLEECEKPSSTPSALEVLEEKASSLFGPTPTIQSVLPELNSDALVKWQTDGVLKKRVIGRTDVDIAAMILKLGNSDWVKQGIPFFKANEGNCPFCQQEAPKRLAESLGEYFDESFTRDTAAIAGVQSGYKSEGERIQQILETAINSLSQFLDSEKLKADKAAFDSRFLLNKQRIENKIKEPSQPIDLESDSEVLASAKQAISEANRKIKEHNSVVENLNTEKVRLRAKVWTYFANVEIKSAFATYQADKGTADKAIKSIEEQIKAAQQRKLEKETEIRNLEKSATSVQPTVNEINRILKAFGFSNFSIGATKTNQYKIIRPDGADARESLSEGEQSFLTFLYFLNLLKGSNSESGMTRDRVVVFDDPVSSLDSDVLFIVSSLIKGAIEEMRNGRGHIKQIFVLTHNVYFHKEITFNQNRSAAHRLKDETFWMIRKINGASKIRRHETNPITTAYDLLWSEIREPNLASQTIQNTLRRILEHYFRILGGISNDEILAHFEGEEKILCRSLLSWTNEGSHAIPDDIYLAVDPDTVDKYVKVFREIFIKLDHENHYNMMTGGAKVIATTAAVPSTNAGAN